MPSVRGPMNRFSRLGLCTIGLLAVASHLASGQCTGSAQTAFEARRYADARAAVQRQRESAPADGALFYCLGRIDMAEGRSRTAVDWFEKAVGTDDERSEYHLWLANALGEEAAHANRFRQALLARRVKSEFERALALDSTSVLAHRGLVQFYSLAPGVLGGSMDRAREHARAIVALSPMRGHLELGRLADRNHDPALAEKEFQTAIAIGPDSASPYNSLGALYQRMKRWDDARVVYERLLARRPAEVNARVQVGRIAGVTGTNLERGASALESVLREPPREFTASTTSSVRYLLGVVYEKQGQRERAREQYQTATKLDPRNRAAKSALEALR